MPKPKTNEKEENILSESLDAMYERCYFRKFTLQRMEHLKAPKQLLDNQKKLIAKVENQIQERTKALHAQAMCRRMLWDRAGEDAIALTEQQLGAKLPAKKSKAKK